MDITKGIQGNYRVDGVDANGCKTSKMITVSHELEVPKVAPFISCPPLTVDLKSKLTDLRQVGQKLGSSWPILEKLDKASGLRAKIDLIPRAEPKCQSTASAQDGARPSFTATPGSSGSSTPLRSSWRPCS